jgi:hypothetical protein
MRLIDADALLEDFKSRAIKARHWKEKAILDDDQERVIRADATLTFLTEVKLTIEDAPTVEDRSLEIAQKSVELGRTLGQIEGKLQRPQGKWIWKHFDDNTGIENSYWCSNCGKPQAQICISYCACCGAQMLGGEKNEK